MISEEIIVVLTLGVAIGALFALSALGLSIILGTLNIVNIAHGAFLMLGMYIAYWLYTIAGIDPLIGTLVAAAIGFGVGALIDKSLIERIRGSLLGVRSVLVTYGLAIVIENLVLLSWKADVRAMLVPQYVTRLGGFISLLRLIIVAFSIAAYVSLYVFFKRTYIGKAIRALTQDERAAALMGVDVKRVLMISFSTGLSLTFLSGGLLALISNIYPSVGWIYLLYSLAVIVFGGMGSMVGQLVSGMLIGVVLTGLSQFLPIEAVTFIIFLAFIIFFFVRPVGGRR